MSFDADKKQEHETAAEKALSEKDYRKAFFHIVKAAEFTLKLAERNVEDSPILAERYADDALSLLDIAEQVKQRIKAKPQKHKQPKLAEVSEEDHPTSPWLLHSRPAVKFDDVAGMEDVKEVIRNEVIEPFLHPEAYQRHGVEPGTAVLLYGPPGTGKTLLGRAIAGELDIPFFLIDISRVVSKWVGDTEKHLTQIFQQASQSERAVLFFDEIDGLFSKRGSGSTVMDRAIAHFLSLVDGVEPKKTTLLMMGTTNKPWRVDEGLLRPGRFSRLIYVGLPDESARRKIFEQRIVPFPHADDIDFPALAHNSEGYSGADIDYLCKVAKIKAVRREIDSGQSQTLTTEDILSAFQEVSPSVSPDDLKKFEKWRKKYDAIN